MIFYTFAPLLFAVEKNVSVIVMNNNEAEKSRYMRDAPGIRGNLPNMQNYIYSIGRGVLLVKSFVKIGRLSKYELERVAQVTVKSQ